MILTVQQQWQRFWWKYVTAIGARGFKNTTINVNHQKTGVHKFQGECALQLGDPENTAVGAGVTFAASTWVPAAAGTPVKGGGMDFGHLEIIQNVKFTYRRTPPFTPMPGFTHECASSNGAWQLDGAPVLTPVHNAGPNAATPYKDSPAAPLSHQGCVFEDVTTDAQFRVYFSWVSPQGARIVLARIDWSWKGHAVAAQNATDCTDTVGGNAAAWGNKKIPGDFVVGKLRTGLAVAFDTPVLGPMADAKTYSPCP